jgi:integrase
MGRPLFTDENEADEAMAKAILEARRFSPAQNRNITLNDFVGEWLRRVREDYQPKTLRSYRQNLEDHVLPSLGHRRVRDITRLDVKRLLEQKRHHGYVQGDATREYRRNTLRLIKAALSVVLAEAVDDALLTSNPCLGQGGRRTGPATLRKSDRLERIRPLTWDETHRFIRAVRGMKYGVVFEVMLYTGARPSEVLGLRPEDVNFKDKTILIEHSLDESTRELKPTKTYEVRRVDLDHFPDCLALLQEYVPWLREEAMLYGWGEPEWLFPSEEGGPLDLSKVRKSFQRVLKRAEIHRRRLYDLRHSFASLRLAEGAPLTYISHQLGHSSPETTLRYYARWIPDTKQFGTKSGTKGHDDEETSSQVVGCPS